jgi:hypothetical protein
MASEGHCPFPPTSERPRYCYLYSSCAEPHYYGFTGKTLLVLHTILYTFLFLKEHAYHQEGNSIFSFASLIIHQHHRTETQRFACNPVGLPSSMLGRRSCHVDYLSAGRYTFAIP